ncbi:MAG: hypothetical protein HC828_21005 [Blastochloris sp.]|nr:hypothetical protein [Blastochloris sp.]
MSARTWPVIWAVSSFSGNSSGNTALIRGSQARHLRVNPQPIEHPDTPREPLIYTQSSPDVPLIVNDLRELAIAQTRNTRSAQDFAGGLSMPVIMDVGDTNGDGSLAWPYQWYLRDFQRMENRNADFFRNATADSFLVPAGDGSGEQEHAPVVMMYAPHVTDVTRQALEANYVRRYATKLNWWFPEGSKCDPQAPGYKRFYYNSWILDKAKATAIAPP